MSKVIRLDDAPIPNAVVRKILQDLLDKLGYVIFEHSTPDFTEYRLEKR